MSIQAFPWMILVSYKSVQFLQEPSIKLNAVNYLCLEPLPAIGSAPYVSYSLPIGGGWDYKYCIFILLVRLNHAQYLRWKEAMSEGLLGAYYLFRNLILR